MSEKGNGIHYAKDRIVDSVFEAKKQAVKEIGGQIDDMRQDIASMKKTFDSWDKQVKSIKAMRKYLVVGILAIKFGLWGSISSLLRHDGNIEAVVKDLQDESKARHFRGLKEVE